MLRNKLVKENATLVQADKSKITVIITQDAYTDKGHTFLAANSFPILTKVPTNKCQALIHQTLQQCNFIVEKHKIKHLIQKKPAPPVLMARQKLHKPDKPNKPAINKMNAPTYKLAKQLLKLLNAHLTLKNHYVTKSTNLTTELTQIVINKNSKLITYDIIDVFVNIPKEEVIGITKSMLATHNDSQTRIKIIELRLVLSQNLFMSKIEYYLLTP
jgi:hypothetical protein